jgi:hypothetical protein
MEMKLQIVISGEKFSSARLPKRSCTVLESTANSCVVTHKDNERDPLNWARKFIKRNNRCIGNADVDVLSDQALDEFWTNVFRKEEYTL